MVTGLNFSVYAALIIIISGQQNDCTNKETCNLCIQSPGCSWCSMENLTRCLPYNSPLLEDCPSDLISAPKPDFQIIQNNPLEVQQIMPQIVNIKVRKGETFKLKFQYQQARNFPIDLYYLMDLSYSMGPYKNRLSKLGDRLISTMKEITSDFKIGFGSFVDKPEMPFVNTAPDKYTNQPYSFINHMSLMNGTTFSKEVASAQIAGNEDPAEGGFDALMQVMVCTDIIGWRPNARHIIVFSTDDPFHMAGDGKLGGIVEPNDGKCHMKNNTYTGALVYDYPSISHINYMALEGKFNIFFAIVDNGYYKLYEELITEIQSSNIGKLSDNANFISLIDNYCKSISRKVIMMDDSDSNVVITYDSDCESKVESGCESIIANQVINFTASITALQVVNKTIKIQPSGLSESLTVHLEVISKCNCGGSQDREKCSNNGHVECGICECDAGHYGTNCECNGENDVSNNDACIANDEICSGLGICKCGVCVCDQGPDPNQIISGKYCQCDNYSCLKSERGKLCNGKGSCECRRCQCQSGWSGESCSCSMNNATCTTNNQVCSEKGECVCGECHCDNGYYGKFCEDCTTCTGRRCAEFKPCVECKVHNMGENKEDCKLKCASYNIETVQKIDNVESDDDVKICHFKEDNCILTFKYSYMNEQDVKIEAEEKLKCTEPINVALIVLGLIGGILLAGIVMMAAWKIGTDLHDKREYDKFENEKSKQKWHNRENPLFKVPVTKFKNPAYAH